jgi:Flp pilus assembly pilin Flp
VNHRIQSTRRPTLLSFFRRFLRDQRGAGLVEYIMLAGLIAIASIFAFRAFGEKVQDAVDKQGSEVEKLGGTGE